jgi:cytochrome c553
MTRPLTIAASLAAVMALASLPHSALAQDATQSPETVATETAAPAPAAPASAAPAALVGNADNGRVLTYTCLGCHGIVGYRNVYPTYHVPMIGGQSAVYLTTALTEYRRGTRKHPTMQVQAQGFSDQDIADIAAFLSELKP